MGPGTFGREGLNVPLTAPNQPMTGVMKRKNRLLCACAGFVSLLFAAGCSRTIDGADPSRGDAIGFAPIATRAVVEDFAAGDAFAVWGWYTPEDAFSQVFDATKVSTPDGTTWGYDGLKYWKSDKTYAFYALYPAMDALPATTAGYASGGRLSVEGFDAMRQVDLMAAAATGMSGSSPAVVRFAFTHLLSRVQVVGKVNESSLGIVDFTPRIYSVKLYGVPRTGALSLAAADLTTSGAVRNAWTGSDPTTSAEPLAEFSSAAGTEISTGSTLLLDVLSIPLQLTQEAFVEVEYSTDKAGTNRKTTAIQLTALPVTIWEAGQQYRYTFSISDEDRILFDIPAVNPWSEAVGGIIIVD